MGSPALTAFSAQIQPVQWLQAIFSHIVLLNAGDDVVHLGIPVFKGRNMQAAIAPVHLFSIFEITAGIIDKGQNPRVAAPRDRYISFILDFKIHDVFTPDLKGGRGVKKGNYGSFLEFVKLVGLGDDQFAGMGVGIFRTSRGFGK